MSLGAVDTNSQSIWGAQAYAGQAAAFGNKSGGAGNFESTLQNSIGFGTRDESGGLAGSIASATDSTQDLVNQLQLSFLKNNGASGVDSRLNDVLF